MQWSPTPVGRPMFRLVCSLKRFSTWAFGFTFVHVCRVVIACYLVYDPTLLVFRRLVFLGGGPTRTSVGCSRVCGTH